LQRIGAFEAKNTLGSLLDRVERGEEIVITRHGKPVACFVASGAAIDRAKSKAAAERIRARAERLSSERFEWKALKIDRGEGRP
jgi:prevent-host-death family protein